MLLLLVRKAFLQRSVQASILWCSGYGEVRGNQVSVLNLQQVLR